MVKIFTKAIDLYLNCGKINVGGIAMNISLVIGSRIKALMEKENVSLRKLSESIGISHPTLKKYVEGEQPIDSEKLSRIAHYFNKPFDYFFKNSDSKLNFLFRADKPQHSITSFDINLFERYIRNYIDVVGNDGFHYSPPRYTFDGMDMNATFKYLEKIAYEQRRVANIENNIPDSYFEVIDSIGIHVITKDFSNDSCFGVSSISESFGGVIMINDDASISEERKIFSLIHEFAHLLFHREQFSSDAFNALYASSRSDIYEKVANKFAGYFLMPRYMVSNYINSCKHVDTYEMKKHFKVSIQTLYFMLFEYGYISNEIYKTFWASIQKEGNKKIEESPIEPLSRDQKNPRLMRSIKELYYKDEITANKIAEVLGMDVLKTRQLLKEWRTLDERYLSLR